MGDQIALKKLMFSEVLDMERTPESRLKRVGRNISQPGECSRVGVWHVQLPGNAYGAGKGLRGFRKIKLALCVWC